MTLSLGTLHWYKKAHPISKCVIQGGITRNFHNWLTSYRKGSISDRKSLRVCEHISDCTCEEKRVLGLSWRADCNSL
jgi:hypothetical protein